MKERIIEKIAKNNLNESMPENDTQIFEILQRHNIISESLSKKLRDAKGMRNWIAQEYGRIDDSIIYESLKEELLINAEEFLNLIELNLK